MNNLRIQDLVAAASGVSLRNTVKVLRAMHLVLAQGEKNLADELGGLLQASATADDGPAALHSKPDAAAKKACTEALEAMEDRLDVEAIKRLERDPFLASRQYGMRLW